VDLSDFVEEDFESVAFAVLLVVVDFLSVGFDGVVFEVLPDLVDEVVDDFFEAAAAVDLDGDDVDGLGELVEELLDAGVLVDFCPTVEALFEVDDVVVFDAEAVVPEDLDGDGGADLAGTEVEALDDELTGLDEEVVPDFIGAGVDLEGLDLAFSTGFGEDLCPDFSSFQRIVTGANRIIKSAGPIIVAPPYPRPKISNMIPITNIFGTRWDPKR
jgi:hypothetical protein